MENANALDLSKENIQPLKRGRNTAQLGMALQAQTDTTLHQMLTKKQEWYEMQIRTYDGSDPLELWCEYISWVEQSFPKHGSDGNLSTLLTKCFQAFKDEEKYKNDRRFVGLWIKYIEMQNDSKRVELYQLLHTQGIGLRCADFYRSWAYEFQCVDDWKQADLIFKKGSSHMAQPSEDLHAAHQQFLASYVFTHRNINNETPEDEGQADHRLPMAALKPVGKKSAAPNVRVGSNVRSQIPGIIPAMQSSSGRPVSSSRTFCVRGNNAGPVTVYQQVDSEVDVTPGQIVPSAMPNPQFLNKENVVKAGPWTGQGLGSRKHQSASVSHSLVPKQPGFEVHKDEDADFVNGQEARSHGIVVPNVLKARKALEDGFQDAIAIFEEPNPFTKSMYRRNEVYGGGKELQLEELHALDYFRTIAEKEKEMRENHERTDRNSLYHKKLIPMDNSQSSNDAGMMEDAPYSTVESHGSYGNELMSVGDIPEHSFRQSSLTGNPPVNLGSTPNGYHPLQPPSNYGPALAAETGVHCSADIPHMKHLEQPQQLQPSNQSMHNQSMTLHTKLAMHEVNNLWGSPSILKTSLCGEGLADPSTINVYQPAFQIMKDDSLPHQLTENSPLRNSELRTYPQNHLQKSNVQAFGTAPVGGVNPGQTFRELPEPMYPTGPSGNFASTPSLFEDPLTITSYLKAENGFQVFQDASYSPVNAPSQRQKFQVLCDDDVANNAAASLEKGDLSLSAHTSGSSVHKIAKEKENIHKFPLADMELMEDCKNIHKFPLADMELMEDCAVAPVSNSSEIALQQQEFDHYKTSHYASHLSDQPAMYAEQPHSMVPSSIVSHDSRHLAPAVSHVMTQIGPSAVSHSIMHHDSSVSHGIMQPISTSIVSHEMMHSSHGAVQSAPLQNQAFQEPMEHDATVSAAPHYGDNMSDTGITEAFFFPQMSAASTPFQASPKKSRASRNTIDFNSSLYRVEQSWPDEDELGAQGSNRAPDAPKTVPPLKLFRIKNDGDQLSAIIETSKEKCQSMVSSGSSRNSMSNVSPNSRYGMYTTQRQSFPPQPYLNQIKESPEPSQEGQGHGHGQDQVQCQEYSLAQSQVQLQPQAQSQLQPQSQSQPQSNAQVPDLQQMNEMARRLEKGEINPFDSRMLEFFLYRMAFPLPQHSDGYYCLTGAVPAKRNNCLNLNGDVFTISKILGEGAYAKVLKGVHTSTQQEVALKIQKPSCRWEYYICREIQHRLSQRDLASAFMPADQIYVYNNGSVIVTDLLPFGTLLNLVNKVVAATKRQMQELQVLYLLDQLISAVAALHKCKIIHGDLKPDNVLIRSIPALGKGPCIQLIDFGRSIDMTLMPEGTTFDQIVMTDTFTCIEMRTGRPWTYQTDLFGLANTAHCLLIGDYMKVQESRSTGRWAIHTKLARNHNADFWGTFFDTLLNIESCDSLPDLEIIRADVQSQISKANQMNLAVSALGRILLNR